MGYRHKPDGHKPDGDGWNGRSSVAAEAARRVDRLQLGEIEIADRLHRVGQRAVLQGGRQRVAPSHVLRLQLGRLGDGVVPSPRAAEPAPAKALGHALK